MQIYQIILPCYVIKDDACQIMTKISRNVIIERINHISKDDHELSVKKNLYKLSYGFELSESEVFNFLTHREAWKKFVKNGYPWCLIVENNVLFNSDENSVFATINELPADWDVFFPYDILERPEWINGLNLINRNHWEDSKQEPYLVGHKLGNSIYLLSQTGAKKLLEIEVIDDRLDHTIMKMAKKEPFLNVYTASVEWFGRVQIQDYNWPDRCRLIYELAIKQSTWTDTNLRKARSLLKTISDVASRKNMDVLLEAGSLLGYVRHGGIMIWDDDIDIGLEIKYLDVFIDEIRKEGLCIEGNFRYGKARYFKIWNDKDEKIDGFMYKYPFVDLWIFDKDDDDFLFEYGIRYPNTNKVGLREVVFEGSKFKIPKNVLEIMDSRYTDWRDTIRVYSWSHRYEKNSFRYLYIPIKTDHNGRMISNY